MRTFTDIAASKKSENKVAKDRICTKLVRIYEL